VYEIALAHHRSPSRLIVAFVGAAADLQENIGRIVIDGGHLAAFLEHALKSQHLLLVRWSYADSPAAATASAEEFLDRWDYAWCTQRRGRARTLTLEFDNYCLCIGCCGGAVRVVEGPPPRSPSTLSTIGSRLLGR
jgi:NADPH-dependent ferric siderophore reductase